MSLLVQNQAMLIEAGCCLLAAAETVLDENGIILPKHRYLSAKGGEWMIGQCSGECCSQLVVTPAVSIRMSDNQGFGSPSAFGGGGGARNDPSCGSQMDIEFLVEWATCVNENVDCSKPQLGDCSLPVTAPVNVGSLFEETYGILIARWALAKKLPEAFKCCLEEMGSGCRRVTLNSVTSEVSGGCAVTELRLTATL